MPVSNCLAEAATSCRLTLTSLNGLSRVERLETLLLPGLALAGSDDSRVEPTSLNSGKTHAGITIICLHLFSTNDKQRLDAVASCSLMFLLGLPRPL